MALLHILHKSYSAAAEVKREDFELSTRPGPTRDRDAVAGATILLNGGRKFLDSKAGRSRAVAAI